MLVNEYRLEIQFKKVQKIRNINNIPTVGSRPLGCKPAQNGLYMVFNNYEMLCVGQGVKNRTYVLRTIMSCSHVLRTIMQIFQITSV
jgi:hypothetical protein